MSKERIRVALDDIARQDLGAENDSWTRIEAGLRPTRCQQPMPPTRVSRGFLLAIVGLLLVSSAAYAFYRFVGGDQGLEGVQQAGLITPIGATALPTVYTTPPVVATPPVVGPPLAAPPGVVSEQVLGNVKVSLDWAYADESRIGLQFTVTGLQPPAGVYPSSMIGEPALTDESGAPLGGWGVLGMSGNPSATESLTITYVFNVSTDAAAHPTLHLKADLPIGGLTAVIFPPEGAPTSGAPREVYIPPLGNFHFEFTVPVYKGVQVEVTQTESAGGVTMRLTRMVVNRSHTEAKVCYSMPSAQDWIPAASFQFSDGPGVSPSVTMSGFRDAEGRSLNLGDAERCALLSFDILFHGQPTQATLSIAELVPAGPEAYTPAMIRAAKEKLAPDGIDFEYVVEIHSGGGGGAGIRITQRPESMSEEEAYERVNAALEDHVEGPWVFVVDVPAAPTP